MKKPGDKSGDGNRDSRMEGPCETFNRGACFFALEKKKTLTGTQQRFVNGPQKAAPFAIRKGEKDHLTS